MRLQVLLGILLLPMGVARAQVINGSKHDFTSNNHVMSMGDPSNEVCKFCHTPHHAVQAKALWNHRASSVETYTWSDSVRTAQGTPLALNQSHPSAMCLGCHDGTVAIGDLGNVGGGVPGILPVAGSAVDANHLVATAAMSGNAPNDLKGNHPVGVPYPGERNYYGVGSGITDVAGAGYNPNSGGVVTGRNGLSLQLERDPASGSYGVECTTCHNPHGSTMAHFLKQDIAGSKLCLVCHDK